MTAARSLPEAPLRGIGEGFTPFVATPKHPSRAMAGLLLAAHRHEEFEVLASGKVRVPSRSKPGNHWTVDPDSAHNACPCPIYRYGDQVTGIRNLCHHVTAAELVLLFRIAAPGVSFRVEPRHDSRFGLTTFDVVEHVPGGFEAVEAGGRNDWVGSKVVLHERQWSTALTLEAALFDVVDVMQDRIAEAS